MPLIKTPAGQIDWYAMLPEINEINALAWGKVGVSPTSEVAQGQKIREEAARHSQEIANERYPGVFIVTPHYGWRPEHGTYILKDEPSLRLVAGRLIGPDHDLWGNACSEPLGF